jgi:hypothetical protein
MTDKLTLAGQSHDQQETVPQVEQSEDRMRRALEQLGGGASPPRRTQQRPAQLSSAQEPFAAARKHRFVQDGEVVVTHVQSRRDRATRPALNAAPGFAPDGKLTVAQDALSEERGLRLQAERATQEAQALIATLQTKLGHNEIALVEARDAVQAHAEAAAKLQAELQLHSEQIKLLRSKLDAAEDERQRLDEALQAERRILRLPNAAAVKTQAAKAVRKISRHTRSVAKSQKARGPDAEEPQPVKWWLSSKP